VKKKNSNDDYRITAELFTKKPNQNSECMLKDYSENVGNVKCSGFAVSYRLVSVFIHVESSGLRLLLNILPSDIDRIGHGTQKPGLNVSLRSMKFK